MRASLPLAVILTLMGSGGQRSGHPAGKATSTQISLIVFRLGEREIRLSSFSDKQEEGMGLRRSAKLAAQP